MISTHIRRGNPLRRTHASLAGAVAASCLVACSSNAPATSVATDEVRATDETAASGTAIPLERNPRTDHLLTPENSTLVLIDYQPGLIEGTHSISRENLVNNAVAMAKAARMYDMPIVVSTIAVEAGYQEDTIPELRTVLTGVTTVDRNEVNAWESAEFRAAVRATGRTKLIMAALWTEVCLMYPALDLIHEGFEVYALSDVSGGTTVDAHNRAMQRLVQAGAIPVTWEAVMAELGRLGGYEMEEFIAIMNEHLPRSLPGPLAQVVTPVP